MLEILYEDPSIIDALKREVFAHLAEKTQLLLQYSLVYESTRCVSKASTISASPRALIITETDFILW